MAHEPETAARCGNHPAVAANGACERCGRFVCVACANTEVGLLLCLECLARPDVRLTPSSRAKRSLWFALLGIHGVIVLLPAAFWIARAELVAIESGDAPSAGKPWARGALAICGVSAVGWLLVAMAATAGC